MTLEGADLDRGVHEPGGADHLLHDALGDLPLERTRGGGDEDGLGHPGEELRERQRAIVAGGGEPPAEVDEVVLAAPVPLVHALELGNGDVRFVEEDEQVLREEVQQGVRRLARLPTRKVAGVVLDPGAVAGLSQHLQVVVDPALEALGLDDLLGRDELGDALVTLLFDLGKDAPHPLVDREKVRGREHGELVEVPTLLARDRVELYDRGDRTTVQGDPVDRLARRP